MASNYDIQVMREEAHEFITSLDDIYYQNWIGLLDKVDLEPIFKKYKHLFTRDVIRFIKRQKPASEKEKTRLRHLLGCFIEFHRELRTQEIRQQIINTESSSFIKFHGERIYYRSIIPRILKEPSRNSRLELFRLKRGIQLRKLNPLKKQLMLTYFKIPASLEYNNYIRLCEKLQDFNLRKFAEEMENVLDESEDLFIKHLKYFLKKDLSISREEAHVTDIYYIRRITQYNDYFPKNKMLDILKKTLAGMGFNLEKQTNIKLDTEARPRKTPRACVCAVNPPEDVRLTVYPTGGFQDYSDIFHETGHAEHFAHDDPDLEMEFKYWGDRGFTEGMAYLFQNLTTNPDWLARMIGMRNQDEFLKRAAFNNLLSLRRLISSFLYELKFFTNETLAGMPSVYARIMGRGHGIQFPGISYLDMDTDFYSAGYVRARLYEVQLRYYLENQFGKLWWKNIDTGEFLRSFYRDGRKHKAHEVVKTLGYSRLDPSYFLEDVKKYLH